MAELSRRYLVMTLATEAPFDPDDPDGIFVLKPWKDPAALRALVAYRAACYPELARDLDAWIRAIQSGPKVRGDVGARNEAHAAKGKAGAAVGGRRLRKPKGGGPEPRPSRTGHPRPKPSARPPLQQKHTRARRRRRGR